MTLYLISSRETMPIMVDGVEKQLPVTLNADELMTLAPLQNAEGAEKAAAIAIWFRDFARPYLGDAVDSCDAMQLATIAGEWFKQYAGKSDGEELGE